jgi:DNA-binding SARP family transcriptional activator/tetratricopeptide (TPR) repeat protein/transcriptional regulator with XRE-family HTH domain
MSGRVVRSRSAERAQVGAASAGVGLFVRAHRIRLGMTQGQLAAQAGISVGALRDVEQGRTVVPRPGSVAGIVAALGLDASETDALLSIRRHQSGDEGVPRERGRGRAVSGLRVVALGPLGAWRDGVPLPMGSVRHRAVLALLLLHPGGVSRAALIDALWEHDPPPGAVAMLQGYVTRLRHLLGGSGNGSASAIANGQVVSWDGSGYRLAREGVRSDVAEFGDLAGMARRSSAAGDAEAACGIYGQALALWRDDPVADIEVLRHHPAVIGLSRERVAVVIEYADAAAAAGSPGRALDHLRALAGRQPLDERVHARLMTALAATGQRAEALSVFEDMRLRLDRELGIRPDRELTEAHVRVLRQETRLEGADRAESVASRPAFVAPCQLPAVGAHFAGRAAELAQLDGLLDRADTLQPLIISISGTAGVGKTALAVHWAHRVASHFADGQLYLNLHGYAPCGEPIPTASAIRSLLDALQVPPDRIPADPDAQVGLYRSLLAERRILIVLDNARDADHVRELLPGSGGCLVVVTSRGRLPGLVAAAGAHPIWLDVLTHADAASLLAHRLGADRLGSGAVVNELIELCARLPLALSVTAARAAEHPGFPLNALVAQLRDERHRLDALETGGPCSGVRSVLSCSYAQLSDSAARMFRLLGVHPGADITVTAAASLAAVPDGLAQHAFGELTRAGLLAEHAPDRFASHDLLRNYATELTTAQDAEADRRAALRRVLGYYLQGSLAVSRTLDPSREQIRSLPPADQLATHSFTAPREALAWFEAEHDVLMAAVARAAQHGFDTHAWQLSWALEDVLSRSGQWQAIQTTCRTALQAATRLGDLTGQAQTLRGLGRACSMLGAPDEGIPCLTRALELFDQLNDNAAHARGHIHMATALSFTGRYADALRHAERALDLFRTADHKAGQAGALNNIGWYHTELGNHRQALACTQNALAAFRQLGDLHGQAIALDSVGVAHLQAGDHARALEHFHHSMSLVIQFRDRPMQAEVLAHLGDAHQSLGDETAARESWTQALSVLEDQNPAQTEQLRAKLRNLNQERPTPRY